MLTPRLLAKRAQIFNDKTGAHIIKQTLARPRDYCFSSAIG